MDALRPFPRLILALGLGILAMPVLPPLRPAMAAPVVLGRPSWDPAAGLLSLACGGKVAWVVRTEGSDVVVEFLDARIAGPASWTLVTAGGPLRVDIRQAPGVVPRVRLALRWGEGARPDLSVQQVPGVVVIRPSVRRQGESESESLPGPVGGARPPLRQPESVATPSVREVVPAVTDRVPSPPPAPDGGGRRRPRSGVQVWLEQAEVLDLRPSGLSAGYPFGPSQAQVEHWWSPEWGAAASWRQLAWTSRGPTGLIQREEDRIQAGVAGRLAPASWWDLQAWLWLTYRQSSVVPDPPVNGLDPSLGLVLQLLPLAPVSLRMHAQAFPPTSSSVLTWRGGADLLWDVAPGVVSFGYDHDERPLVGGTNSVQGALRLGFGWLW